MTLPLHGHAPGRELVQDPGYTCPPDAPRQHAEHRTYIALLYNDRTKVHRTVAAVICQLAN
jgi:hypothetical protein